jgi:glucoamylase
MSLRAAFATVWNGAYVRVLALAETPERIARRRRARADLVFPPAAVGGRLLAALADGKAIEPDFGLLAAGQSEDAGRMLAYLLASQQPDGHWLQNFYPDGSPFWQGIQLDEVGFPVLLAAKLGELGRLDGLQGIDGMVWGALGYLARHGPVSPQDRWEENAGASPFSLAVEVAALVVGAPFLPEPERAYALSLADCWNERIEAWTYSEGGRWADAAGVEGYYVRIAPAFADGGLRGRVQVRDRPGETVGASELVSMDFLYLSRLGLRAADDARMKSTLAVAETLLRVDTPLGVSFHRYNGDGYGEHPDGSPFDGSGVGRAWPLLTGERGHQALLLGEDSAPYLDAMAAMTGPGGLIPEQVWDGAAIPSRFLFPGKPSGSAMPLVWAHAEFLKLLHARQHERAIELLASFEQRYAFERPQAASWHWRDDVPFELLPPGRGLIVEGAEPFVLHLGRGGWQDSRDLPSAPLGFGMHGVTLAPAELGGVDVLLFTRFYPATQRWEGVDHTLRIARVGPSAKGWSNDHL